MSRRGPVSQAVWDREVFAMIQMPGDWPLDYVGRWRKRLLHCAGYDLEQPEDCRLWRPIADAIAACRWADQAEREQKALELCYLWPGVPR